jgi:tripartite-type tricarboxylate transporter receptor subunit TctC
MFRCIIASAIVGLWTFPAYAQSWPDRAVKLIVPFPAGGPSDSTARLLAERLAENLNIPSSSKTGPASPAM